MRLNDLMNRAKRIVDQRGGTDALKEDAQELKDIHAGEGSLSDKSKAAVDALKDPGAQGPDRSANPDDPDRPDRTPGPEQR